MHNSHKFYIIFQYSDTGLPVVNLNCANEIHGHSLLLEGTINVSTKTLWFFHTWQYIFSKILEI